MNWNPFKHKPKEPPFNIHHPDVADRIELAFACGPALRKRKFYRMKADVDQTNEFRLPTGRYKWVDAFLAQVNLRMSAPTLSAYMGDLKKALNGGKGEVRLDKAFHTIFCIESRLNLGFDPNLVKTLASIVYFDETEDLSDYDKAYCDKKIKFWEQYDCYDFFLTRPIAELCNLNGSSVTALKTYIRTAEEILGNPILEPLNPSLENT